MQPFPQFTFFLSYFQMEMAKKRKNNSFCSTKKSTLKMWKKLALHLVLVNVSLSSPIHYYMQQSCIKYTTICSNLAYNTLLYAAILHTIHYYMQQSCIQYTTICSNLAYNTLLYAAILHTIHYYMQQYCIQYTTICSNLAYNRSIYKHFRTR